LESQPDFSLEVDGVRYAQRPEAGTALMAAINKCKSGVTTGVGKFKGFEVQVEKNFMGANYLILQGATSHPCELSLSPIGNVTRLENVFNGMQESVEFLQGKIEEHTRSMEQSKLEYEKPFAHEEELRAKTARQAELDAELDLENKTVEDMDLTEQETKSGQDADTREMSPAEQTTDDERQERRDGISPAENHDEEPPLVAEDNPYQR
jgi:hypothetical protein